MFLRASARAKCEPRLPAPMIPIDMICSCGSSTWLVDERGEHFGPSALEVGILLESPF
jgi:hypothetical protein